MRLEKKVTSSTKSDAINGQQEDGSANDNGYLVTVLVNWCCDNETELASEWMKEGLRASPEIRLSIRIQEKVLSLVLRKKHRRIIPDVIHDCFKCITKEAELILERLRNGVEWHHRDNKLSHDIRTQVFRLVKKYLHADPFSASVPTRAVLLGITKEAELIWKKLRQEGPVFIIDENAMSRDIRSRALAMLTSEMDEYVLKRGQTAGFCYRHYIDPAVTNLPTCHEKELGDVQAQEEGVDEVHASDSDGLSKENYLLADLNSLLAGGKHGSLRFN